MGSVDIIVTVGSAERHLTTHNIKHKEHFLLIFFLLY
jgi:hypothetical protein